MRYAVCVAQDGVLSHESARRVYDRIGAWQDSQAFYEDVAVRELVARSAFGDAKSVVEFGCGTGRHAERLLREELPADATYVAVDQSTTMAGLASERLGAFGDRARVVQTDGAPRLPVGDGRVDRVFSTYVMDLLSPDDCKTVIAEAHRALEKSGRLCLVSLTRGTTRGQRLLTGAIERIHARAPSIVGGCRPIELKPLLDSTLWNLEHHSVVSPFGLPSEVLVASPRKT